MNTEATLREHGWVIDRRIALPTLAGLFAQTIVIAVTGRIIYGLMTARIAGNEKAVASLRSDVQIENDKLSKRVEKIEVAQQLVNITMARLEERLNSVNNILHDIRAILTAMREEQLNDYRNGTVPFPSHNRSNKR